MMKPFSFCLSQSCDSGFGQIVRKAGKNWLHQVARSITVRSVERGGYAQENSFLPGRFSILFVQCCRHETEFTGHVLLTLSLFLIRHLCPGLGAFFCLFFCSSNPGLYGRISKRDTLLCSRIDNESELTCQLA